MTCNLCKFKGHNKRGCLHKDTITVQELPEQPRRKMGRPRKDGQPPKSSQPLQESQDMTTEHGAPTVQVSQSQQHLEATSQPIRSGRNERVIRGGVGSKGVRGGKNRGRGRVSN